MPAIKKRKTSITPTKQSIVSPLDNWLVFKYINQRQKFKLTVPGNSYKSQVIGYHEIYNNPTPRDLLMSSAEVIKHPAYTIIEYIGAAYFFLER